MFPPIEPDFPPEPPRRRIIIVPVPPRRRGIFRRYLPLLLWMTVIFLASTKLGRPENSEAIIDPILSWLGVANVDQVHIVVRKMGHVVEYSIFGFLLAYFCLSSPWQLLHRRWFAASLIAAFVYACSDEFHQLFVPERTGSLRDVMIDTASATLALCLVATARWLLKPRPTSVTPRP
jgi:VanZ family protein